MTAIRSIGWWVVNTTAMVLITIVTGIAVMALALLTGLGIFLGIVRRS
jgi:hypothetical protein